MLAEVPGTYINLGAVPAGGDHHTAPFNHPPLAVFDESVLADGTALYAELATRLADLVQAGL